MSREIIPGDIVYVNRGGSRTLGVVRYKYLKYRHVERGGQRLKFDGVRFEVFRGWRESSIKDVSLSDIALHEAEDPRRSLPVRLGDMTRVIRMGDVLKHTARYVVYAVAVVFRSTSWMRAHAEDEDAVISRTVQDCGLQPYVSVVRRGYAPFAVPMSQVEVSGAFQVCKPYISDDYLALLPPLGLESARYTLESERKPRLPDIIQFAAELKRKVNDAEKDMAR